nr:class I SAM-dependent methyltransferase [uncultured Hyphomonas sp.]
MTSTSEQPSVHFDAERAEIYDQQYAPLQPLNACLHLLLEAYLADLPENARILIAGAGTGAEVRYLAPRFPGWHFTLVDPSAPMLAKAQHYAEADGFADRCTLHAAYVSDTPSDQYDAATSLLVSHFLMSADARQSYFRDIAARLKPGGRLFNADLCTDDDAPTFEGVMGLWLNLLGFAGLTEEGQKSYRASYGREFAGHGPDAVANMIEAAGFTPPAPIFQSALIRGWTATRR